MADSRQEQRWRVERWHERRMAGGDEGCQLRMGAAGDGLDISGYIARFGEQATISDYLGEYVEQIRPGAFARTLVEVGAANVKMQFEHGRDPQYGALGIGVWTSLREDRFGLFGEGRLHDSYQTIPLRVAIDSGSLDGMSFRFRAIGEEWVEGDRGGLPERILTEVRLYEGGPVTNPAYTGTSVSVRSAVFNLLSGRAQSHDDCTESHCTIMSCEKAVAAGGDTGPNRAAAGPPGGITRRDMRRMALTRLGVHDGHPDRGASRRH